MVTSASWPPGRIPLNSVHIYRVTRRYRRLTAATREQIYGGHPEALGDQVKVIEIDGLRTSQAH